MGNGDFGEPRKKKEPDPPVLEEELFGQSREEMHSRACRSLEASPSSELCPTVLPGWLLSSSLTYCPGSDIVLYYLVTEERENSL